jgi:hypothetical protein
MADWKINSYTKNEPKLNAQKMVRVFSFFKFFCVCLLLEKPINKKHFLVKEKFDLIFRKVFSFYFERKILFRNYKKFKNIILFADYIKFDLKLLIAIYFILNIFF